MVHINVYMLIWLRKHLINKSTGQNIPGEGHLQMHHDLSDSAASPNPAGASPRAAAVRRRTTNSKAQTSRAPGPSTSGMMRIYTDDSPGLRVYQDVLSPNIF
ncbi:hypothetical protein EDD11_003997 [Mortierella claussenii]|nr:hypothetical protein EDD11_003997 [Mortierella claussenii]